MWSILDNLFLVYVLSCLEDEIRRLNVKQAFSLFCFVSEMVN